MSFIVKVSRTDGYFYLQPGGSLTDDMQKAKVFRQRNHAKTAKYYGEEFRELIEVNIVPKS